MSIKAKKISKGNYEYRGYRLHNHGYYEPENCVWWEAVNMKTGCADYHDHTKWELIRDIDEEIDNEIHSLK